MNLNRILLLLFLLLASVGSNAQNHFHSVGNFTAAMNIYVLESKVNGVDLAPGDEIGIFSGNLCVGSAVLNESLGDVFDTKSKSGVAGSDDIDTQEKDGFSSGEEIVFKFWDASEKEEITVSEIKYYNPGDGSETSPRPFEIEAAVYVSLNTTFNYKPKSNAGDDQILFEGVSGYLDGTGSVDLNNDVLFYTWIDLDTIGLNETDVASPVYTAPLVSADKDFRIVLVVSDGVNESDPDTVIVTVVNVESGPVANAGSNITINELEKVELDGSLSFDPDGQALSWNWELSDGSIELVNGQSVKAGFMAPEVQKDTTIYAVLVVTDFSGLTDRDTVYIDILNVNQPPVAVAVYSVDIQEGEQVVLDGSNSYDLDAGPSDLTYQWNGLNGGEIMNSNQMNASFTAPWLLSDSTFYFTLIVFDGDTYSSPDTVAITVIHKNLPPVSLAGEDLVVEEGAEVILSGKSSFDPEGQVLLYEWSSDYLILDDTYSSDPIFIANQVQKDTSVFVTLRVTDKELWSETDTVFITIKQVNKSPEWLILPPDSAYFGKSYFGIIEVYDPDIFDTIQISVSGLPSWLTFTDSGDGTAFLQSDSIPKEEDLLNGIVFSVYATDGKVQIDTTFTLNIDIVSGNNEVHLGGFKVFPNPSNGWIIVQVDNWFRANNSVRLYNSMGGVILEEKVDQLQTKIYLNNLSSGFYLLELAENGRKIEYFKILLN